MPLVVPAHLREAFKLVFDLARHSHVETYTPINQSLSPFFAIAKYTTGHVLI